MDKPQIDPEIHHRLVAWARWARGRYLPPGMAVRCISAESGYIAPVGNVYTTAEEALRASIRASEARHGRGDEWETERAVAGLQERPRLCVRLHYVGFKSVPMARKRQMLQCDEMTYWDILDSAVRTLQNRLTIKEHALESQGHATIRP